MATIDDVLEFGSPSGANVLETAVLIERPQIDPRATLARPQSTLMLANPSSLALSLIAIAALAATGIGKKTVALRAAQRRSGNEGHRRQRRRAA